MFLGSTLDTCGVEPSDWLSYLNMLSRANWVIACQETDVKPGAKLKVVEMCVNCTVHEK